MNKTIAIDGPSASGKSSVSKGVAKALNFLYVDSGAFYRGVTWHAIRNKIDPKDTKSVIQATKQAQWNFFTQENAILFSINNDIPTQELREKPVREAVATVATIPEIRTFIVKNLQELVKFGSLVMEGRDIGTVVFPETPYKFFLDADPKERAMRRYRELIANGENEKAEEVMKSLKKRDQIDATRSVNPLVASSDAKIIDSTFMTLEEVINTILKEIKK